MCVLAERRQWVTISHRCENYIELPVSTVSVLIPSLDYTVIGATRPPEVTYRLLAQTVHFHLSLSSVMAFVIANSAISFVNGLVSSLCCNIWYSVDLVTCLSNSTRFYGHLQHDVMSLAHVLATVS